jgi:ribonucleotide reductase beta subunit family protein with ferritin-like domain
MKLKRAFDYIIRVRLLHLYSIEELCEKVVKENREVFESLAEK